MESDSVATPESVLVRFKELNNTDGWTIVKEGGGVVLDSIAIPGEPIRCFRVKGIIAGKTPKELAEAMWAFGKDQWKILDSDILEWKIVEQPSDDTRVMHQVNNLPWPIWNRDTVTQWKKIVEGDAYYLSTCSTTHDQAPEDPKNLVRAIVPLGVYAYEPEGENNTKLTRMLLVNPAGNIPASIVNSTASGLFNVIEKITNISKN